MRKFIINMVLNPGEDTGVLTDESGNSDVSGSIANGQVILTSPEPGHKIHILAYDIGGNELPFGKFVCADQYHPQFLDLGYTVFPEGTVAIGLMHDIQDVLPLDLKAFDIYYEGEVPPPPPPIPSVPQFECPNCRVKFDLIMRTII